MTFKKTNGEEVSKSLKKSFEKFGIADKTIQRMDGSFLIKLKQRQQKYVNKKVKDYGEPDYPTNTILILDDFMGSDLLERKESPVVKLL
jgi:hypothetical protein